MGHKALFYLQWNQGGDFKIFVGCWMVTAKQIQFGCHKKNLKYYLDGMENNTLEKTQTQRVSGAKSEGDKSFSWGFLKPHGWAKRGQSPIPRRANGLYL